jgi:hypothetical protein
MVEEFSVIKLYPTCSYNGDKVFLITTPGMFELQTTDPIILKNVTTPMQLFLNFGLFENVWLANMGGRVTSSQVSPIVTVKPEIWDLDSTIFLLPCNVNGDDDDEIQQHITVFKSTSASLIAKEDAWKRIDGVVTVEHISVDKKYFVVKCTDLMNESFNNFHFFLSAMDLRIKKRMV